jgi:hypothetical protein
MKSEPRIMRARGRLPPKDPHQIDAAFPDVPEAFDRYERMFRFNQLPRERRNDCVLCELSRRKSTSSIV